MTTGKVVFAAAMAGVASFALGGGMLRAQAHSYTWYAELASVDPASKTMTVKTQMRPAVGNYVGSYKPGDKLMLTWVPIKGESDTVIYAPKYDVMKGIDDGYILPVEFVSADPANRSLTVRTAIPDSVLQSVRSIQPGKWIKVITPMEQPKDVAALTAAMAAERPDLKPPPPPPPAEPAGRGRGRSGAPPRGTESNSGISGTWTVSAGLSGNNLNNECTLTQIGTKLTGTCKSQMGQGDVTGEVNGTEVKFLYNVSYNGMLLDFAYLGTLDGTGTSMKGSVTVFGMPGEFSATKK